MDREGKERESVDVDTSVDVHELVRRSAGAARVRIRVPVFTDGRVFSQVRALVESDVFDGVIEVRGDLLPDQVTLLERYGVREVWLENGMSKDDQPRYLTGAYRERRLADGASGRTTQFNKGVKQ